MSQDDIKVTTISSDTVVVAAPDQVSTDLEEEAVVLHLKDGVYYGLNPLGARIWKLLEEPRKVGEIRDILVEEYEVAPGPCESDLTGLLQELAARGLIEVKVDTTA
jgi:hypothetical protein